MPILVPLLGGRDGTLPNHHADFYILWRAGKRTMGLAVKGGGAMPVFGVDPFCAAEMAGELIRNLSENLPVEGACPRLWCRAEKIRMM